MLRSLHPVGAVETIENGLIFQRTQGADRLEDGLQVKVTHGNQFARISLARCVAASLEDWELRNRAHKGLLSAALVNVPLSGVAEAQSRTILMTVSDTELNG